jgi:lysine-N-methylase
MDYTPHLHPTYAAAFRCIGDRCEDDCCSHWEIPLDRHTYQQYQLFPANRLGATVSEFVSIRSANAPDALHAWIGRRPSGHCAFFAADRLCDIQREYGPHLLSATCSIYPRSLSLVAGRLEGSLSLSCPEAARNVLLDPNFLDVHGDLLTAGFRTDNVYRLATDQTGSPGRPAAAFPAIRQWMIATLRQRPRPLWHRLLDIGALCRRLEDPAVDLHPTDWNTLPNRPGWKLDILFELAGALMNDQTSQRLREAFRTAVDGLASQDPTHPADYIDRFIHIEERYHRPFFAARPHILENYLINYILQHLFPYGRAGSPDLPALAIWDQFLLLATHFAWLDTILIGIAGHHREAFAEEHVVHAVQSFTRDFEHDPAAPKTILSTLQHHHLDTLEGMAILLRR